MAKAMSMAGLIAGGLIALIFLLDLFLGIPFGGKGSLLRGGSFMDIAMVISGGILTYLSFSALRETE